MFESGFCHTFLSENFAVMSVKVQNCELLINSEVEVDQFGVFIRFDLCPCHINGASLML